MGGELIPSIAREGPLIKTLHIAASCVPASVAIYLLGWRYHSYSNNVADLVQNHRATVQIFVQVIAYTLAFLQIYALRTTINFAIRLQLPKRSLRLDQLSFWTAITLTSIDWSLPAHMSLLTGALVLFCLVPGALWAGALTPVLVPQVLTGSIKIPHWADSFSTDEFNGANGMQVGGYCGPTDYSIVNKQGYFPLCPVPALAGLLVSSASSASTVDGSVRQHTYLNKQDWTFSGRSYGVGSSAGPLLPQFNQSSESSANLDSFLYPEQGFMADVKCAYNSSSNFSIGTEPIFTDDDLYVVNAGGHLPNTWDISPEHYPMWFYLSNGWQLLTWASRARNNKTLLAISGYGDFAQLNKVQCELIFEPWTYSVTANISERMITVTPLNPNLSDAVPPNSLLATVVEALNLLARVSTSLYSSTLGDALYLNIYQKLAQMNTTEFGWTNEIALSAVEESFTAMLDDLLVAYGATQSIDQNSTRTVAAEGYIQVQRVGEANFIFAIAVINSAVLAVVIFEAVRTRFWHNLTKLNYADIKSVMIASSAGGSMLASMVHHQHSLHQTNWVGDPNDKRAGRVHVRFAPYDQIAGMPVIEAATIPSKQKYVSDVDSEKQSLHGRGPSKARTVSAKNLSRFISREITT